MLSARFLKLQGLVFTLLLTTLTGIDCAGGQYLRNRGRDAADIFTVEVETRAYGLSARLGPFKAGAYYKDPKGTAYGLRDGVFGEQFTAEFTALLFGADYHMSLPLKDLTGELEEKDTDETDPEEKNTEEKSPEKKPTDQVIRESFTDKMSEEEDAPENEYENEDEGSGETGKTADGTTENTADPSEEPDPTAALFIEQFKKGQGDSNSLLTLRNKQYRARSPFGTSTDLLSNDKLFKGGGKFVSPHYYTQIEVSAGVAGGVKVGFNPGELLDFVLGWFGLDIFSDDAPYENPQIRALKKSPLWKQLDPLTKQKLLKALEKAGP